MKTSTFPKLLAACLVALNCACFYQQRLMPPSQLPLEYTGRIEVLTADGTRYRLDDAVVGSVDLFGSGWRFPLEGSASPYRGAVPLSEIVLVQTEQPRVLASLVAWGAIGIVAGHMIASASDQNSGPMLDQTIEYPVSGGGSCPYVFSYDGKDFRFESETFAGAVCASLERTVVDPLHYLTPVDGRYILAVTNQSPESQHTNELALLAVEHSQESRVVPDSWGKLHTITHVEAPIAVRDEEERDITRLLVADDDEFWGAIPRDSAEVLTHSYREALYCDFRLPTGAANAKLLLHARNSSLGFYALGKLVSLLGPDRLEWYNRLCHDPNSLAAMKKWLRREAGMEISVLTDAGWQLQAWIPDVGPQAEAERIVPLDLSFATGSFARIKIESAAGLWTIDQLGLDWSVDETLRITELELLEATDQSGRVVTSSLKHCDSSYYSALPGDFAALSFAASTPNKNVAQSLMLRSRGHYYSWTAADSVASGPLFEQILSTPGLGSRLYWQDWNRHREYWDSFYDPVPAFKLPSAQLNRAGTQIPQP